MRNHPELSYQHAAAQGASPIGQVIALYDTILRDLGKAQAAIAAGNIETRVSQLNHALTVIGYLQIVLDHERGGEAAKTFERFYIVTRDLIVKANFNPSPESLKNLVNLFGGVRQAWYEVEQQSKVDLLKAPPTASPEEAVEFQAVRPAYDGIDITKSHWSV